LAVIGKINLNETNVWSLTCVFIFYFLDKRSSETVFHLLVREKNKHAELWEGARSGTQAAIDVFNADEVRWTQHANIYILLTRN
jgi:hypothetical protein